MPIKNNRIIMKHNRLLQILLAGFLAFAFGPESMAATIVWNVSNAFEDIHLGASGASGSVGSHSLGHSATWRGDGHLESPIDGSSVTAGVSLLGTDSFLTGEGFMRYNPGSKFDAHGLVAVAIYIHVSDAVNYRFASTLTPEGGDAIIADVTWLGDPNNTEKGGGTVTQSGTLLGSPTLPAVFTVEVDSTVGHNVSGGVTWSFALSLTPVDIAAGKLSAAQKADFYEQSQALQLLEQFLFYSASGSTDGMRDSLLSSGLAIEKFRLEVFQNFLDPLDTNYTAVAQPVAPAVAPLAAGGSVTQLEAGAFNSWQTNLAQSAGYATALTTALNRAQGAATVGDSSWETAQMNAAVQFEAQLASLMDQELSLRSNVAAQFESGGFPAITVTTNDAINLQLQIITNGLPAGLLDAFTTLGVDSTTISNIQDTLLTADVDALAGSFPGSLVNTKLDSTAKTLAADLRDASLMLINARLLPGGQFRFDLPTEPGYNYTIEFTQNLADPAGWTTIFANHATTALMSFTNTPPLNGPAGFYRASHN
jgi:hypothetical protein